MKNGKDLGLEDLWDELRIASRLLIVALARGGIQQKDIAAAIGVSDSVVSRMFPTGLLKRLAQGGLASNE